MGKQSILIDQSRRIVIQEAPARPLVADELRIQTQWASGKIGTEMAIYKGSVFGEASFDAEQRIFYPRPESSQRQSGESILDFSMPLGTTGIGVVSEVGEALRQRWREGDLVLGLMKIAEENICTAEQVWPLEDLAPEVGLCFESANVAFHAVREGGVQIGDDVAIFGLGALGILAVQLARLSGAHRVFGIDPLPARRELASQNGADQVFAPSEELPFHLHDLTEGQGVDVAVEISGQYQALAVALKATRMCGTVSCAGFYQGEAHSLWLGREFHHNRLNLVVPHGCGYGHPPRAYPRWDRNRAYDVIIRMMKAKQFVPQGLIYPVYSSLAQVKELFESGPPADFIKYAVQF